MTGPSRFVEIERKFDVGQGTSLPDWAMVSGVDRVTAGEVRRLDALYLDTADLALARAGVAVRRRTGGPDAGWHVKGPLVDGARLELGWPLDEAELGSEEVRDAVAVPADVRSELAQWTGEPLTPLARIVNDRTAYGLLDAAGGVVAEFADDRVRTADLRGDVEREWHEWEIELGPAAPADREAFFAAITEVAIAAGASAPSSASKLARALGR